MIVRLGSPRVQPVLDVIADVEAALFRGPDARGEVERAAAASTISRAPIMKSVSV